MLVLTMVGDMESADGEGDVDCGGQICTPVTTYKVGYGCNRLDDNCDGVVSRVKHCLLELGLSNDVEPDGGRERSTGRTGRLVMMLPMLSIAYYTRARD